MFALKARGLTLVELLITAILVGILSTLALNYYTSYRERTLDREAQANLRLIIAAEKIYKIETGEYYASGSSQPQAITNINDSLKLLLSTTSSWNYFTTASGGAACCGQATRNATGSRTWSMRNNDSNPNEGGTCP